MTQSVRTGGLNVSKVLRNQGFAWTGVPVQPYKKETHSWKDVARHWLIGDGGETTKFHVRYFEVAPGGFTTLEVHRHEHVVIPLRGRGEVRFGDERAEPLGFGDCVYVAPSDPHQFRNTDPAEPFGFLCIVNAERDPPKPWKRPGAGEARDGGTACEVPAR